MAMNQKTKKILNNVTEVWLFITFSSQNVNALGTSYLYIRL